MVRSQHREAMLVGDLADLRSSQGAPAPASGIGSRDDGDDVVR